MSHSSSSITPELDPPIALFRLLVSLGFRLRALMDAELAPIGLTTQQAAVLTIASDAERARSIGAIGRAIGTSHQNARQIVDALERKGLVRVVADASDGRARLVEATPRVAELFEGRNAADHDAVRGWLGSLSEDEQRVATSLMRRVADGLSRVAPWGD